MSVTIEQILEHRPNLEKRAFKLLGDHLDAEEIVNDTISTAWQFVQNGAVVTNLPAWLATILRNLAFKELRRRDRVIDAGQGIDRSQPENIEDVVSKVNAAMRAIPEAYRDALIDRFVACIEDEIVAARDEVTEITIRRRVQMAKEAFRAKFEIE